MIRSSTITAWIPKLHGQGISLLLLFSLTTGLLYGTILVRQDSTFSMDLLNFAAGQAGLSESTAWISAFFQSFLSLFLFLTIPYLCGFCAIGQVGACLTLFFKGLGLGAVLSGFYVQYQWQGIGYCAIAVIPPAVCAVFTLFLACRESIRLANRIFSLILHTTENGVGMQMIRLYHIKFLVIAVMAIGSSLFGAIFSVWFKGLFVLTGS